MADKTCNNKIVCEYCGKPFTHTGSANGIYDLCACKPVMADKKAELRAVVRSSGTEPNMFCIGFRKDSEEFGHLVGLDDGIMWFKTKPEAEEIAQRINNQARASLLKELTEEVKALATTDGIRGLHTVVETDKVLSILKELK